MIIHILDKKAFDETIYCICQLDPMPRSAECSLSFGINFGLRVNFIVNISDNLLVDFSDSLHKKSQQ